MALVASSSTLVAVHGQALAWVVFLPSERRRTAAVEVALANAQRRFNPSYKAWCDALGVRYFRTTASLSRGCTGGANSRDNEAQRHHKLLSCNVTVDAHTLAATVHAAARAAREAPPRTAPVKGTTPQSLGG